MPETRTLTLDNSIMEKFCGLAILWPGGRSLKPEKYKRIPSVSSTNFLESVPPKIVSSENKLTMLSTSELLNADRNLWNTSIASAFPRPDY